MWLNAGLPAQLATRRPPPLTWSAAAAAPAILAPILLGRPVRQFQAPVPGQGITSQPDLINGIESYEGQSLGKLLKLKLRGDSKEYAVNLL